MTATILNFPQFIPATGREMTHAAYLWKRDWAGKVLFVADKHPIFVGEVGADIKKRSFIPAEAQEDAATWVPEMLGMIQKRKLHWTGFSFHPKASPVMIAGWELHTDSILGPTRQGLAVWQTV